MLRFPFMKTIPFLLALLIAAATASVGFADPVASKPAPAWTLKDLDGKSVSFEQFKGKVVVIDFWATWCGPCRVEIPGYIELQKKYGKDGLVIIGISIDEKGPAVVKQFSEKMGINYQMLMADDKIVAAFGGIEAIPTTFIIDRAGKIQDRKEGAMPTAEYEKRLLTFLK
jgi:thiol-disulfide isomerase/thioredoxin